MNLRELTRAWLEQNNYGGLFNSCNDCGCECADLMPCDDCNADCEAGYKTPCTPDCEHDTEHVWHIQREKPE